MGRVCLLDESVRRYVEEGERTMSQQEPLTTAHIHTLFTEEVTTLGGTVSDKFDDGTRLFTRAILPDLRDVGRDDMVKCGVALRAVGSEIRVHPYVFRLICKYGAI